MASLLSLDTKCVGVGYDGLSIVSWDTKCVGV